MTLSVRVEYVENIHGSSHTHKRIKNVKSADSLSVSYRPGRAMPSPTRFGDAFKYISCSSFGFAIQADSLEMVLVGHDRIFGKVAAEESRTKSTPTLMTYVCEETIKKNEPWSTPMPAAESSVRQLVAAMVEEALEFGTTHFNITNT